MGTEFLTGAGGMDYQAATEDRLIEQVLRHLDPVTAQRTRFVLGKPKRFTDLADNPVIGFPFRIELSKEEIPLSKFTMNRKMIHELIGEGYSSLVFPADDNYHILHPDRRIIAAIPEYGRIHVKVKGVPYVVEPFVSFAEAYAREIT